MLYISVILDTGNIFQTAPRDSGGAGGGYMTGIPFSLCPLCASRRISYEHDRHWVCVDCGFDLFNNVASAVGIIIAARDTGRVLFERRAKEPRRGFLALPGGFTDPGESLEESAIRECREETGATPECVRYVCSFPNTYRYKNVVYKTCDCFFAAELPEAASEAALLRSLTAQQEEVQGFVMREVTADTLADLPFAFESARRALLVWLGMYARE